MSTPGQGSILGSPIIYAKVDYGPTYGQVYRPVNQKRVVTVAGTDTIQPFDQTVIYNKTVPAAFSVNLPDLNLWMTQPYGGFDLALIDGASNAGTYTITITPFGSQKIDGQSSTSINTNDGSLILVPLVDRTGWEVLAKAGSGGGGGTPHAPVSSVQFNEGGSFGGNAGFTYDRTTELLVSLTNNGGNGGQIELDAGKAAAVGTGGQADLIAGDGGSTSGNGGAVRIVSGDADGSGNGGEIQIFGGDGSTSGYGGNISIIGGGGDNGDGGDVSLTGGDAFGTGTRTGGDAGVFCGSSHDIGDGGAADLASGHGGLTSGNGGDVRITAGDGRGGNANGGNIILEPGTKNAAGTDGHLKVTTLANFTTDALALAGGVPVTGLYRNGNTVRVNAAAANESGSIDVVIDGAGAIITTGLKGYLPPAPFAMTVNQATLTANAAGSVVVNIWKCTYAQFDSGATHPVVGDKITASAPPTISAATKSQDSTLTGWTTAIAAGDILAFNIDSVATIQQVGLSLKYTKA